MNALVRALVVLTIAASGSYAVGGVTTSGPETTTATDDVAVTTTPTTTPETSASPTPKPTPSGRAFATAKQAWVSCVQDAHALHREAAEARRAAGEPPKRFDRVAACGEKPHPRDFGLASSEASEVADTEDAEDAGEHADDADDADEDKDDNADHGRGRGHDDHH